MKKENHLEKIKQAFTLIIYSFSGLEQTTSSNASSSILSREKRASLDIIGSSHQRPQRHIIIPDIQFSEDQFSLTPAEAVSKDAPKLLLSSPTEKTVLPPDENSRCKRSIMRPSRDWRSQTAFELSSSVESEASAIVSEFLTKTGKNDVQQPGLDGDSMKLESYV